MSKIKVACFFLGHGVELQPCYKNIANNRCNNDNNSNFDQISNIKSWWYVEQWLKFRSVQSADRNFSIFPKFLERLEYISGYFPVEIS